MTSQNSHPYKYLSEKAFWRKSIQQPNMSEVDPVANFGLKIDKNTKVATAGSCFAQHIARYLQNSGYNYYVAEAAHPLIPEHIAQKFNYGTFSARYGNVYTSRQLLQLFRRAFGLFTPQEVAWRESDGTLKDPFRPNIQVGNFSCLEELEADRKQHLSLVREMFETLDVFVFTLGLTECWRSKKDGAVFPVCPGTIGGDFDLEKYEFYNQTLNDVTEDLQSFLSHLMEINPNCKVVLTVSPVPLVATAEKNQHVLQATTYSKSVLRVAAEQIIGQYSFVEYFPSYEIITGNFNRGEYYADDLRSVLENGVAHVMSLFMKYTTGEDIKTKPNSKAARLKNVQLNKNSLLVEVECEEAALDDGN